MKDEAHLEQKGGVPEPSQGAASPTGLSLLGWGADGPTRPVTPSLLSSQLGSSFLRGQYRMSWRSRARKRTERPRGRRRKKVRHQEDGWGERELEGAWRRIWKGGGHAQRPGC